jgi:hypothetical protein
MASLDDLFATAKNIVTAINGAAQTYLTVNGTTNAAGLTAATVVKASAGRICSVSVIDGGSAVGVIYDATSTTATARPIYTIPMTAGVYPVNIAALYGIVVVPGTSQVVSVGFS